MQGSQVFGDFRDHLTRTGRAIRLVQGDGSLANEEADRSLVKLLTKARRWWLELELGEFDMTSLAAREGGTRSYMIRVVRLAFLSRDVVEAILDGRQHGALDAAGLKETDAIPICWQAQAKSFLPAGSRSGSVLCS